MEQALEEQRIKLLRLLAGWIAVAEWVLVAPFIGGLPRWLLVFLGSVLTRAEFAAQHLIVVSACMQARQGFAWAQTGSLAFDESARDGSTDCVLATQVLVRRMKDMQAVLESLPRHGRRLLRRQLKRCSRVAADGWRCLAEERIFVPPCGVRDETLPTRRVERPPDRCRENSRCHFTFLPMRAEGEGI